MEDGQRALDVLRGPDAPDAVVLDVVLPRLNGLELLDALCVEGASAVPVVVVSGFGPVTRFDRRRPCVRAVVQKPVDVDRLLEAVERCLRPAHAA